MSTTAPRALKLARGVQELFAAADKQGRPLTADERTYAQELLDQAHEVGEVERQFHDLGRSLGGGAPWSATSDGSVGRSGGPGDRLIASEQFKKIAGGGRGLSWSTGLVECGPVGYMMTKGTLLEGIGSPGDGSGGGLLPVPQVAPGVVNQLAQPLTVEGLLSTSVATGNEVRHIYQGTATSAAAAVAEGAEKPESTLGLGVVDEPVRKTATVITLSDEILDDAPAVRQFVNSELSRFVNIEVERQLLRGSADANEVVGLLNRGVPVYTAATATDGAMPEQLFRAINSVRGSAFIEPEWIVMSPADYQTIRLAEDSNGRLYGGGPFFGPYGNGGQAGASGQITGATDQLWGKQVHVTSALGVGTALIGQSQAARVWNRGGLQVELSNSHASYFQSNLCLIRAERRLALTVFRTAGFCELRFAS